MKRRTSFKGIKGPGIKSPGSRLEPAPDPEAESMEPEYIKVFNKKWQPRAIVHLDLFGNPYDPNY
jgi:hypothetical protein